MTDTPAPGFGPDRDDARVAPAGGLDPAPRAAFDVDGVPFGLPVLDEVPELTSVLVQLREVDRLLAGALDGLIRLQDTSLAETATGVPLERWLAVVARRTGADRRMLATAAHACRRLPTLHDAFSAGRVSWAQVRAVALAVDRLPTHLDDRIDGELAKVLAATQPADPCDAAVEPDDLVRTLTWTLAALHDEADRTDRAEQPCEDWLAMQPRLDGSGGQVHGDFGADGFALLDATLNEGLPAPTGPVKDGPGADTAPERARVSGRQAARHRAAKLLALCAAGARHPQDEEATGTDSGGLPGLLLRAELSTLLGRDGLPGDLLTRLTGGVLHVDAATARRLTERYGARLRLVLVDHGRIVGVGRSSRQPPGWLGDALLALHETCSEPGCATPARHCEIDHARPWSRRGGTDVDNLAPVCSTTNHRKEEAGWRVHQAADGVRIWTHPRTGVSTKTLPARWRPPPDDHVPAHSRPRGPDPPRTTEADRAPPAPTSPDDGRAPPSAGDANADPADPANPAKTADTTDADPDVPF